MNLKNEPHRTLYAPWAYTSPELDFIEKPYSSIPAFIPKIVVKTREILIKDIGETPLKVHIPLIDESRDNTEPDSAIMANMHDTMQQANAMGKTPTSSSEKKVTFAGATITLSDINDAIAKKTEENIDELNACIEVDILLPPKEKTGPTWRTGARLCKTTSKLPKPPLVSKSPPKNMYV